MSDPLGFPVLAGSAITQAFGFLYGRLEALLDRRRANHQGKELEGGRVTDQADPVISGLPDEEALEELLPTLNTLAAALEVYNSHPAIINGEDPDLRRSLGQLREALEAVYHQHIPLPGEEESVPGVKVNQEFEEVSRELTGVDAEEVKRGARVDVEQKGKAIHGDGRVIGARIKRIE
jgi:hypothetical protein